MYDKFFVLLEQTGKTTYQVAKDTGVSTATLTCWKQGKYTPKIDKIKTLADYFGVSVEHFLS